MRTNIRAKLIMLIISIVVGVMLFSIYFISKMVETRMTKMFRENLDNTLDSVEKEYGRIEKETLASAKSFAEMMAIVRNVMLKEIPQIQQEVINLKAVVDLDLLEVGDEQGLVMVGGSDLDEYGKDKSGDHLIQAALAGKAVIEAQLTPAGLLIKAVAPIKLQEKVLGTFTTGRYLDESFLEKIKKMTGVELFLFKKERAKEGLIAATLAIDKAKLQNAFNKILNQKYAYVTIDSRPYMVGIVSVVNVKKEVIATIRGARPRQQLIITIVEMRRFLILIGLVGIIVAWVIGYIFAKRITIPLQLLVQGTNKLATGDLSYRVEVKATDELGVLADSFNKMADDLRRITVSHDELAKEVSERKKAEQEREKLIKELKEGQELLKSQKQELEDINKIMVGRELKMIELKKEINRLSRELGRPAPYDDTSLGKAD